jgi:tRNA 2-thiouridine synthesizing protein A
MNDTASAGDVTVDARGMRCPWPALQAAKAMRRHARIRLIADDPRAEDEARALAAQHGWTVTAAASHDDTVMLIIAA